MSVEVLLVCTTTMVPGVPWLARVAVFRMALVQSAGVPSTTCMPCAGGRELISCVLMYSRHLEVTLLTDWYRAASWDGRRFIGASVAEKMVAVVT